MYYPMYPYYDTGAALQDNIRSADNLSSILTAAIGRRDAAGARWVMDYAFTHAVDFKPDWFHLCLSIQQGSRELTQLMVTYGTRLSAAQLDAVGQMLPEQVEALRYVLAQGGMRLKKDTAAKPDALVGIEINMRLLQEKEKAGLLGAGDRAAFGKNVGDACLHAALSRNYQTARRIFPYHPDAAQGLDVVPMLLQMAKDNPQTLTSGSIREIIDSLRAADIPLRPVALDLLQTDIRDFYDLVPFLHSRGLLGGDINALQERLLKGMMYAQENLELEFLTLKLPPEEVAQQRLDMARAAQILLTADIKLAPETLQQFVSFHEKYAHRQRDAAAFTDETLIASRFFDNPAVHQDTLATLAQSAPNQDLQQRFNRLAGRRQIEQKGLAHFLHHGRIGTLLAAMESKAYVPPAIDAKKIVDYLHRKMPRRGMPEETLRALRALKQSGADLSQLNATDYLGSKEPQIAKALLDLDILRAKDISFYDLQSKIRPNTGASGIFAKPADDGYALREFLYQVKCERDYPQHIAEMRSLKDFSYQRLHAHENVIGSLTNIFYNPRYDLIRGLSGKNLYGTYSKKGRTGPKPGY